MSLEEKSTSSTTNEGVTLRVGARPQTHQTTNTPIKRQFVNFTFYKIRPEFRFLNAEKRESAIAEFVETVESFGKDLIITSYSLVGLRKNVDFMVWRVGYDLDFFQAMTAKINQTTLGKYLEITETFLSMTKRSMYIDRFNPEHDEDRLHVIPGKGKYLFIYPFVKTRAWYMKTAEQRQELMDEHIVVGMKYKSVKLHTTYSFGLDDQEFVVAFETDYPNDFLDLVEELRFTKASEFTLRDTPMFSCRQRTLRECLAEI